MNDRPLHSELSACKVLSKIFELADRSAFNPNASLTNGKKVCEWRSINDLGHDTKRQSLRDDHLAINFELKGILKPADFNELTKLFANIGNDKPWISFRLDLDIKTFTVLAKATALTTDSQAPKLDNLDLIKASDLVNFLEKIKGLLSTNIATQTNQGNTLRMLKPPTI